MSDASVLINTWASKVKAFLSAKHPGDSEAQALMTEADDAMKGLANAAGDVPALVSGGGRLAVDAMKLAADVAAKSLNLGDVVAAGRDAGSEWEALQKAWTDYCAGYKAAEEARAAKTSG